MKLSFHSARELLRSRRRWWDTESASTKCRKKMNRLDTPEGDEDECEWPHPQSDEIPQRSVFPGWLREIVGIIWGDADRFVRRRLGAVVLLVVTASVLTALGPLALKWLVDGFTGQARIPLSPFLLVGAYVLSQFLARAVGEVRGLAYARAERRMFRVLSGRLFAHLLRLPLRFHLERHTGGVNQTLENGLTGYQMILHHLVFTVLPVTAELGTIVVVLVRMAHPIILALFCGALLCYAVAFGYAAMTIARSAKSASAAHVDAAAQMTDALLNVESVKCFCAETRVQRRIDRALSRMEVQWVAFYRRYAVNGVTVATIFAAFLSTTTFYAVHEVEKARLTVGDFVLITSYLLQLVRPVEALGYAMQGFSQGAAMLEKLLVLFHEQPEPQQPGNGATIEGPGQLEFENVTLSYGPGRAALRGVSFKVPAGTTVGIVGASGSGKSTLARLLVRFLEPDAGRILLDGVPICGLPLATLRQSIAVVPQDAVLFNDSIGENIAIGQADCTQDEIEQAAGRAHLHELIASLPDAYDTNVGERGLKLSGGERQRLSIARAAIKRPRIYIFDEATSALDSATELQLVRNLQEISRSITTLVISHRLSSVMHADDIIVLEQGMVVERGTHASLLRQHGRYAAFWSAQHTGSVAA
jgi:ABC-type transport system involved in Fe-S cluster assembly fused permease/ATPase subunit